MFIRFTVRIFFELCVTISVCVYISFPFGFESERWDLIVLDPEHCLSFYFVHLGFPFLSLLSLF